MDRIERIKRLEASASESSWLAAELISEELATGKTGAVLAKEIGKSPGHVSKCKTLWARYGEISPEKRPEWVEAYREVSGKDSSKTSVPKQKSSPEAKAETKPEAPEETASVEEPWIDTFSLLSVDAKMAELVSKALTAASDEEAFKSFREARAMLRKSLAEAK